MIAFFKRLWAAAPIATLILVLAVTATGFFTVRSVIFTRHWKDRPQGQLVIEGWMTPGFVAHAWHVPPQVLFDALNAPRHPTHPLNLDELAVEKGMTTEALIAELQLVLQAYDAEHRPPPPPEAPPAPGPDAGTGQ